MKINRSIKSMNYPIGHLSRLVNPVKPKTNTVKHDLFGFIDVLLFWSLKMDVVTNILLLMNPREAAQLLNIDKLLS